jgi:hypothetical protein
MGIVGGEKNRPSKFSGRSRKQVLSDYFSGLSWRCSKFDFVLNMKNMHQNRKPSTWKMKEKTQRVVTVPENCRTLQF